MTARDHWWCATCGTVFDRPCRWAYCCKICETGRDGRGDDAMPDLDPVVVDRMLRSAGDLESAPWWQRTGHAQVMRRAVAVEARRSRRG